MGFYIYFMSFSLQYCFFWFASEKSFGIFCKNLVSHTCEFNYSLQVTNSKFISSAMHFFFYIQIQHSSATKFLTRFSNSIWAHILVTIFVILYFSIIDSFISFNLSNNKNCRQRFNCYFLLKSFWWNISDTFSPKRKPKLCRF